MRIIKNDEVSEKPSVEKPEEPKEVYNFNDDLVNEISNELYGVNFYTSLGICFKTKGLCGLAKFYWKLAEKTMCIKDKIKEFLLCSEHCFTIPAIEAVKLIDDCFNNAVTYEYNRINGLYKLMEKAPCDCTKNFVCKLIEKHSKIKHFVTLADNINKNSEDLLLVQQEISKLICNE